MIGQGERWRLFCDLYRALLPARDARDAAERALYLTAVAVSAWEAEEARYQEDEKKEGDER